MFARFQGCHEENQVAVLKVLSRLMKDIGTGSNDQGPVHIL
jgi:hypothetical protein